MYIHWSSNRDSDGSGKELRTILDHDEMGTYRMEKGTQRMETKKELEQNANRIER